MVDISFSENKKVVSKIVKEKVRKNKVKVGSFFEQVSKKE
jgi:hypothetical protein